VNREVDMKIAVWMDREMELVGVKEEERRKADRGEVAKRDLSLSTAWSRLTSIIGRTAGETRLLASLDPLSSSRVRHFHRAWRHLLP
jgi:hypothetical protein